MEIPADLWTNPRPNALIQVLERHDLDAASVIQPPLFGQIDGTDFLCVRGISRIRRLDQPLEWRDSTYHSTENLVPGLHGLGVTLVYLVVGGANSISVYMGLRRAAKYSYRGKTLLHATLRGLFPGIQLDDDAERVQGLGQKLRDSGYFSYQGIMTGIPTLKRPTEDAPPECSWDYLLRGMYGESWGFFVLAKPTEVDRVVQTAQLASEARRLYSFHAKEQMQKAPGVTAEIEGGLAYDALELLNRTLERLGIGKAQGMWEVEGHFFSPSEVTLGRMSALLRSAFAGKESRPEPIRTLVCTPGKGGAQTGYATLLTSPELATIIQLPQEERPGYVVRELARFDVAPAHTPVDQALTIGQVLDATEPTGNEYAIERADLAKHTLIAGVTGSGKTNTCFQLLDQVWQRSQGVPFLVIEPAKTEYRDLFEVTDEQGRLIFAGLRVFTLGNERIAPFRLNPFEFEILDEEHRTHVQTHVDHLKSVFSASFVLYAPMPHVLERCLHEVYRDKGWDLASGANRRVPKAKGAYPPEVFPTLTDLHRKIAQVVDTLGYEERISMDVRAALETRIDSLRIGGKGLMLDTQQSVPMADLLSCPTVLELEGIGDDEEKAFVIGLLLTRLYQYRVAQAKQWKTQGQRPPGLQHVTVVEEAHRLLRHVPLEAHPEVANVRGKAVETFTNMLAEIRAYGEGILVAEQIPEKLAPDVVKSTNLKVLHRLVAEDDRQLVGGAMNLDEAQKRFVATLDTGQVVVFAEGDDRPLLVAVHKHAATENKAMVADQEIAASMSSFCTGDAYAPYEACTKHCRAMAGNAGRCPHHVRDRARSLADHFSVQNGLACWVLSVVEEVGQFTLSYPRLQDAIRRLTVGQSRDVKDVLLCTFVQGLESWFERKMQEHDWLLEITRSLKTWLLTATVDLVYTHKETDSEDNRQILERHRNALERFRTGFVQQCKRDIGPYVGCLYCARKCLFRHEVDCVVGDRLLSGRILQAIRDDGDVTGETAQDEAMWKRLSLVCLDAGNQVITTQDQAVLAHVALCYAASVGPALGFSQVAQEKLVGNLRRLLLPR